MAEIIFTFAEPFIADDVSYVLHVCGRPARTVWEGWLEFVGANGRTLVTPRETTQPDRRALEYWATGLSQTYFEGAFLRAAEAEALDAADEELVIGDGPVTSPMTASSVGPFDQPSAGPAAVLDPFSVGAKGEELLRSELLALSDWHLRNIVRAYDLADDDAALEARSGPALVELIVNAAAPPRSC